MDSCHTVSAGSANRSLQPLRQAAECEPGLQLVRDQVAVQHLAQQFRREPGMPATAQRRQRMAPASALTAAQQDFQSTTGAALIVAPQGQGDFSRAQRQRLRRAGAPQLQRLAGTRVIVGQQCDPRCAFGQPGIAVGRLCGIEVPTGGLVQLARLQRELAGDGGLDGVVCRARTPHGRGGTGQQPEHGDGQPEAG